MKNRKIKILLAILTLLICISQIKQTYAKYTESKEGNTDFTIANWKIIVNDKDITEASSMSSLINPVYIENDNVANNVIAPQSEGYFDLNIDASKTQVSFKYSIKINTPDDSSVTDLKITGYQINDESLVTVNEQSEIANTVNYKSSNKTIKIRVYFKWIDDTSETMNNEKDTQASINNEKAKLKVNLAFIQST